jgi:EpsI family protein
VKVDDDPGLSPVLPDTVGLWQGSNFLFCQNASCLRRFRVSGEQDPRACSACDGELNTITLAERTVLPADTEILKKEYTNASGHVVSVSVVFSGYEQKSIHRPQQCLPALGHVIEGSSVVTVPAGGRPPLEVMILNLRRTMKANNETFVSSSAYAYWFTDGEKATPSHYERLLWMSIDRIFRNRIRRWAYIAISTSRTQHADDHLQRLQDFIREIYPLIQK